MDNCILQVDDLGVCFHTEEGRIQAVDGVSFALHEGETLGIVGESGSGKSVTSLALMGLVPSPPGEICAGRALYRGENLLAMPPKRFSEIRGNRIAMIFQDPMTSLNPYMTIADQLIEVTVVHLGHSHREALKHAIEMLERVGIPSPSRRIFAYPHEFSGGMRQRVMIAMALSCQPDILIADEPTTALDVTIEAQILELMKQLQQSQGTAIIMITHDMGVVANICHRVHVMYAGKIVEQAGCDALFANPRHPYTLGLLKSVPRLTQATSARLATIDGQPPDLAHLPIGCAFEPRCGYATPECRQQSPQLQDSEDADRFACFVDITKESPLKDPHV